MKWNDLLEIIGPHKDSKTKVCEGVSVVCMCHTVLNGCVFLLLKQEIHSASLLPNCPVTQAHTHTHS